MHFSGGVGFLNLVVFLQKMLNQEKNLVFEAKKVFFSILGQGGLYFGKFLLQATCVTFHPPCSMKRTHVGYALFYLHAYPGECVCVGWAE